MADLRDQLCADLRRNGFGCQASELEAATTPEAECAALEHVLSFLSGYQRALDRHCRALRNTGAGHESRALAWIEVALFDRLAVLSADRNRRTGS